MIPKLLNLLNFNHMKFREISKLLCVALLVVFIIPSCVKEGSPGLDGADGADGIDGADGADGHVTCLVCHGGDNIEAIQGQFAMSRHGIGEVTMSREEWSSGCVKCHTPVGFVHYANTGTNLGNVQSPGEWECNTCHGLHQSFDSDDYALRLSDPVAPIIDASITMDLKGNSNLCVNCHQSRAAEPNKASPGETFRITSTHYGPHYSTQGNVLAGVGFAEISGSVAYPAPGSAVHLAQASCVGCHMAEFASGEGGHSWNPSLNACNDCHDANDEDFNYGGVQSDVQTKLVTLRDKLIELGVVEGDEEHGYHPVVNTFPMLHAQAFYNWKGLAEDRSLGVHNPKYVRALLNNTLEALE
jgi:hypothetical protein